MRQTSYLDSLGCNSYIMIKDNLVSYPLLGICVSLIYLPNHLLFNLTIWASKCEIGFSREYIVQILAVILLLLHINEMHLKPNLLRAKNPTVSAAKKKVIIFKRE